MRNKITVIIPTIKYSEYLDLALTSVLKCKFIDPEIVINIGSNSKTFKNSIYWNSSKINWRIADPKLRNKDTGYVMTYHNINDGILNSKGDWLYILADDDIVKSNFLKNIKLKDFDYNDLYYSKIEIIDEDGNHLRESKNIETSDSSKTIWMSFFFNDHLHHHLSMFIFSRKICKKLGYFSLNYGFPNGYYGDTLFNGKLIANCKNIISSIEIVFCRRESKFQESSKFFFKNINKYFEIISDDFFSDKSFKVEALNRFRNKEKFKQNLMESRFFIENFKLSNKIFDKNWHDVINFQLYFLIYWKVGLLFKLKSFKHFFKTLYNQFFLRN